MRALTAFLFCLLFASGCNTAANNSPLETDAALEIVPLVSLEMEKKVFVVGEPVQLGVTIDNLLDKKIVLLNSIDSRYDDYCAGMFTVNFKNRKIVNFVERLGSLAMDGTRLVKSFGSKHKGTIYANLSNIYDLTEPGTYEATITYDIYYKFADHGLPTHKKECKSVRAVKDVSFEVRKP